ncbi:MAG: hypothetical protein LBJ60_03010 [Tannerellaceae bacterium]|jgi:hypothetical protein|nr:hypothetical protein [Tannerellaceae bacterium]
MEITNQSLTGISTVNESIEIEYRISFIPDIPGEKIHASVNKNRQHIGNFSTNGENLFSIYIHENTNVTFEEVELIVARLMSDIKGYYASKTETA